MRYRSQSTWWRRNFTGEHVLTPIIPPDLRPGQALSAKAKRGKLLTYNNLSPLPCASREEPVPHQREGWGKGTCKLNGQGVGEQKIIVRIPLYMYLFNFRIKQFA